MADEPTETTVAELAPLYRQMLAIRRMEEAAAKAYSQGKIGGFLHLNIGQEAVCVGAIAALEPDDYVVATYREHGHAYAKGVHARARSWPSSTARRPAARRASAARCTSSTPSTNFLGGYGIVGGHVPLAAGVAFASKYRGDGRVTLCFFGDGASTHGGFHEGLALAGAVEAAGRLHLREQPVLDGHAALPHARGRGRVAARARATAWRAIASTATTSSRSSDRIAEAVERARNDRRADAGRGRDLPLPRPLDDRPRPVPHEGRGRGVEEARSAHRSRASGCVERRHAPRPSSRRSRTRSRPRSRTR